MPYLLYTFAYALTAVHLPANALCLNAKLNEVFFADFIFTVNLENHLSSMSGTINCYHDGMFPRPRVRGSFSPLSLGNGVETQLLNPSQALSKKEGKGGMDSPLGDDSDHEGDFSLTPRTEAKYNKIDEEFHLMMQRNQLNGVRVSSLQHSLVTLIYSTKIRRIDGF